MAFSIVSQLRPPENYLLAILNKLHDSIPRMNQIWETTVTPKVDVCEDFAADMKRREELLLLTEGMDEEELSRLMAARWWAVDEDKAQ